MAKYRINKAQITVPSASSSGRYRGTGVRLQNIMKDYVDNNGKFKNLEDLKNWGANIIRLDVWTQGNAPMSEAFIQLRIPEIISVLKKCEELGMKVVIALMEMPGAPVDKWPGRYDDTDREHKMYYESQYYDEFIAIWETIVSTNEIKLHPALYAYGILNEPVFKYKNGYYRTHVEVQNEVIAVIRNHDTETPIAVACSGWDSPPEFEKEMSEFKDSCNKLIYEFHMYEPHEYTHQGVDSNENFTYPGYYYGAIFDKKWLEKQLEPVVNWQRKNPSKKIYVGEFSTVCWSEGGAQWLEDCMSLYEKYKWDWTYHCFREYEGWSVEHKGIRPEDYEVKPSTAVFTELTDDIPYTDPGRDRIKVLKKHLQLNGMKSVLINKV